MTRVHDNSLAAFRSEEAKLSKRAELIYTWILDNGPKTDREVMQGMKFPDMNNVRPRITELLEAHRLMEVCNRRCAVTGKTVRVIDIRRPRQALLPLQNAGMDSGSVQITKPGKSASSGQNLNDL